MFFSVLMPEQLYITNTADHFPSSLLSFLLHLRPQGKFIYDMSKWQPLR